MSMSTGGGASTQSNLNLWQTQLAKLLGTDLKAGLERGATELPSFVSPQEEEAAGVLMDTLRQVQEGMPSINQSLESLLSGTPAFETDLETSAKLFENAVATPALQEFTERILPTIQQGYKGFSSRMGKAIGESSVDVAKGLQAELAKWQQTELAAGRASKEAALDRILPAVGMKLNAYNYPAQLAAATGAAYSDIQGKKVSQAQYMSAEANPYYQLALQFLGTPMTSVVNQPSSLTGFGTALAGLQGVANVGSSYASLLTSAANTAASGIA